MKVLVIGGGISDERDVSIRSAKSVYNAAISAGHEATFFDWEGDWQWLEENIDKFEVALPILHGKGGEDGTIQEFLEKKHIAYLGTDKKSSVICYDKNKTREVLEKNGILVPRGQQVDLDQYKNSDLSEIPHVLKPATGGSSIDTLINVTKDQVDPSELERLFATHEEMLLEEYIEGTEATMPILDGKDLPVIEIIPPKGQTFDYENKYNGTTDEVCPPINIDKATQLELQALGKRVHEILGCRHLSRVDVILSGQKAYVLEANTMPGMTDASLFPLAAKTAGISMSELVDYLIKLAYSGA